MGGKCKTYSIDYVLNILRGKFVLKNIKSEYTSKDTLELTCSICHIELTKKVEKRLNGECRNCNLKNSYLKKVETEMKKYPEILSWRAGVAYKFVTFMCTKCGKENEKIFKNFKKSKLCSSCSAKEASKERYKDTKLINILHILNSYNIDYKPFKKHGSYDTISVRCKCCNNYHDTRIYNIIRKCRSDGFILCSACVMNRKRETSSYNMVKFYRNNTELGERMGYLYFYDIKIDGTIVYKMGITRNDIRKRILLVSKLYEISNIRYITDTNLNNSIKERELKNKYKDFKILPEIKFEGYTECFTKPIDLEENMKVQRLTLSGSTTQADGVGSG